MPSASDLTPRSDFETSGRRPLGTSFSAPRSSIGRVLSTTRTSSGPSPAISDRELLDTPFDPYYEQSTGSHSSSFRRRVGSPRGGSQPEIARTSARTQEPTSLVSHGESFDPGAGVPAKSGMHRRSRRPRPADPATGSRPAEFRDRPPPFEAPLPSRAKDPDPLGGRAKSRSSRRGPPSPRLARDSVDKGRRAAPPTQREGRGASTSASTSSRVRRPKDVSAHHVQGCFCRICQPKAYDRGDLRKEWKHAFVEGCLCPDCNKFVGPVAPNCANGGHKLPEKDRCGKKTCECLWGCGRLKCAICYPGSERSRGVPRPDQ